MVASMKFIFGIVMFPLTYLIQYMIINYYWGMDAALVALGGFVISMPLYKLIDK
jgi:hypothetical protein